MWLYICSYIKYRVGYYLFSIFEIVKGDSLNKGEVIKMYCSNVSCNYCKVLWVRIVVFIIEVKLLIMRVMVLFGVLDLNISNVFYLYKIKLYIYWGKFYSEMYEYFD